MSFVARCAVVVAGVFFDLRVQRLVSICNGSRMSDVAGYWFMVRRIGMGIYCHGYSGH